jgi:hypothetical protein
MGASVLGYLEGVREFKMQTLDFIGQNTCPRESRKVAMPLPSICGSAGKHGLMLVSTVSPCPFHAEFQGRLRECVFSRGSHDRIITYGVFPNTLYLVFPVGNIVYILTAL